MEDFSDALKSEVSKCVNKSRYFSPLGKKMIGSTFANSVFWRHFFDHDRHDIVDYMYGKFGKNLFNENDCVEHTMSRNSVMKGVKYAMSRVSIVLPKSENFDEHSYRISPRTIYFFLEFGCLRQVKPACRNRACVNPYHQITESLAENDDEEVKNDIHVRKFSTTGFVFGMSMDQALNAVYEAGNTPQDILRMPVQDFVNVAMAHYNYMRQIKRETKKNHVALSVTDISDDVSLLE